MDPIVFTPALGEVHFNPGFFFGRGIAEIKVLIAANATVVAGQSLATITWTTGATDDVDPLPAFVGRVVRLANGAPDPDLAGRHPAMWFLVLV